MSAARPLTIPLENVAGCFEGIVPATVCSCSKDGRPNLTYLSIIHRLDESHVGISFQFSTKTRKNIQENPRAQALVVLPQSFQQYRLDLRYERTDSTGPAYERMRLRLEAVASQSGMSRIFRLQGIDVYEVLDCRPVAGAGRAENAPPAAHLRELESFTAQLEGCEDLDTLLSTALDALATLLGHGHSFVLFPDETGTRLYTGASHGFEMSGVGSEVTIGEGVLGIAAQRRSAVRIGNMSREMLMARAVRTGLARQGREDFVEKEIALPGLRNVQSQLVLPLVVHQKLLGVLCLQSETAGRYTETDEREMQIVARHLATSMAHTMLAGSTATKVTPRRAVGAALGTSTSTIKHYRSDDSIFVDHEYLIKGIPGRLLWKLLQAFIGTGRAAFTNKEIRLDTSLGLPDFKDNLETRLILLRRRLAERCLSIKLLPAGRGRLQLEVRGRLVLEELP